MEGEPVTAESSESIGVDSLAPVLDGVLDRAASAVRATVADALGGLGHGPAVALLAGVASLGSADGGAIGALAGHLEHSFHFGNTRLGLLVTVSSLVGTAGCIPMGFLADRTNRTRLLVASVTLWSLAMVSIGLATSYTMLMLARVALGVVTAATGPIVASLTGDLFPAAKRGSVYGVILTGEIAGSGAGLLASGAISALADWRLAFFLLGAASAVLGGAVLVFLREPERGCQQAATVPVDPGTESAGAEVTGAEVTGAEMARARGTTPADVDTRTLIREDPASMGPLRAVRCVLRVGTNRVLIVSSALGYFFLAGLRTFAILFAKQHYRLGEGTVSALVLLIGAGALAGTLLGARFADRSARRGRVEGRLTVAGLSFVVSAVLFLPGIISTSVPVALPLFVLAAVFLASPNPPLDAARLDVMPSRMWGRAESVRTLVRTLLEGFAPLLFGFVSAQFATSTSALPRGATSAALPPGSHLTGSGATGLESTFLLMLIPLAASGALLLRYRSRYRRDVATAAASERLIRGIPELQTGLQPATGPATEEIKPSQI